MDSKKFIDITREIWIAHFRHIRSLAERGLVSGRITLYPNILIFTETKHHFIAELVGANPKFDDLKIKKHRENSTERYLSQFDNKPSNGLFHLNSSELGFSNLCLAHEVDFEAVQHRFPVLKLFPSRLMRSGGHGALFTFGESFESAYIENCVLVNRLLSAYRVKHILCMIIVHKEILTSKYTDLLKNIMHQGVIKGVHICSLTQERDYILAGQFQNFYLFPSLRETTIGEFLNTHREIIERGLLTRSFIYEPYLPWIKKPYEFADKAIKPDFLLQRTDGYFDIYDLKTAALQKHDLTKSSRRRRRFIDYVEEGVAQLANYREYFSYPENASFAKEKYGVELKDPNFVLVVGNYQNSDPRKIQEASRRLSNITIIDYDTLVQLFLSSASQK